jgi:copper(I)-binding protein
MIRCSSLFLLAIGLLPVGSLRAAQADHVTASQAWIRLLPAMLPASGYVTLQNHDSAAATLISAHSGTYASVMLHRNSMESSGMNSMSAVNQMVIPAHGNAALAPAGYHLMLEHSNRKLEPGDSVDITLDFADGSQLPVRFLVRPANTDSQ